MSVATASFARVKDWLTTQEAALIVERDDRTVRRWAKRAESDVEDAALVRRSAPGLGGKQTYELHRDLVSRWQAGKSADVDWSNEAQAMAELTIDVAYKEVADARLKMIDLLTAEVATLRADLEQAKAESRRWRRAVHEASREDESNDSEG